MLRFANVYGPRQIAELEGGVVAIFLERMRDGQPTLIFGDGEQSRDFVYVGDIVRALVAAGSQNVSGVFNVGTGQATTVNELHAACRRAAGSDTPPTYAEARAGRRPSQRRQPVAARIRPRRLAGDDARRRARED